MPVYNAERFLEASVNSILNQSFHQFELIAINDGSVDESIRVLQKLANVDKRLRILDQPNVGIVESLNRGINASRGAYIARMDADDLSFPTRLEQQLRYLELHPDCVAVGCQILCIDKYGDALYRMNVATKHDQIVERIFRGSLAICHPAALIRRDALLAIGGYLDKYRHAEDFDLWLRLIDRGRLANVKEMLLKYRIHDANVSCQFRHEQYHAMHTAMSDYCARHSIPIPHDFCSTFSPWPSESVEVWRSWATKAFRLGSYRASRRYCTRVLMRRPLELSIWKILIRSIIYPCTIGLGAVRRKLIRFAG